MSKAEEPAEVATVEVKRPSEGLPIAFGKYTLVKRLGRGGMAEAFLAQTEGPSGFQKTLVIKRMLNHLVEDEDFVRMFQREARLAALLTHTNVVQIYELGEIDGVQFIGMEYVDGAPLHDLARGAWRNGLSLPLEVVCCAIADAALGLSAAHELCDESGHRLGIVHRDISPDNLMMNREGVTKILDFGVAKAADGEKTATGMVKGKLPYLAPEQVMGRVVDGRTDLYALGVTFYGLVTGKRPFSGKGDVETMERILKGDARPPCELNVAVPRRVNDLILRLLSQDPAQRPQDGAEVHDEIVEALASRRTVVVPYVRSFLAGTLATAEPTKGPRFCHALPVSAALLAWPKCEGAEAALEDGVGTSSTMMRGNLISSEHEPVIDNGAQDLGPLTVDDSEVERIDPTRLAALPKTVESSTEATAISSEPSGAVVGFELPAPKKRTPTMAIAAAVAALVLVVTVVTVVAVRSGGDDALVQVAPALVDGAPVVKATVTEPVATAPIGSDPVAPVGSETVVSEPVVGEPVASEPVASDEPASVRKAKIDVQARAPTGIQWFSEGKLVGAGNAKLKVAAGTSTVIAIDKKRGGRSPVRIVGGVADYGALPRGKIHPRANPYAEVFLGTEALGTTPFPAIELPVGTYALRFVHAGREEKRTVEVTKDAIAKVSVNFE